MRLHLVVEILFFAAIQFSMACPVSTRSYTYRGDSLDYATDIIALTDGGYAVCGQTWTGTNGYSDMWLVRLDADLDVVPGWPRTYGQTALEAAAKVLETDDHGLLLVGISDPAAQYHADVLVYKVTPDGDIAWQRAIPLRDDDRAYSAARAGNNCYVIAGSTGSHYVPPAHYKGFLLKVCDQGDHADSIWTCYYSSSDSLTYWANDVHTTSDGGFIIGGYASGPEEYRALWALKTTQDGMAEDSVLYQGANLNGQSIAESDVGGYLLAGWKTQPNSDSGVTFALFLDVHLQVRDSFMFGFDDRFRTLATSVQPLECGGFAMSGMTGSTQGPEISRYDAFLLEVDYCGRIERRCVYGSDSLSEVPHALIGNSDDGFMMAGYITRTMNSQTNYDAWVLKLGADMQSPFVGVAVGFADSDSAPVLRWCANGCCSYTIYSSPEMRSDPAPTGWTLEVVLTDLPPRRASWTDPHVPVPGERKFYQVLRSCP